jgi:excisionase family DNA binding protein
VNDERVARDRGAFSPAEAAEWLGIGRSTFYRSVLPELAVVTLGRRVLIPVTELEAWLARSTTRSPIERSS